MKRLHRQTLLESRALLRSRGQALLESKSPIAWTGTTQVAWTGTARVAWTGTARVAWKDNACVVVSLDSFARIGERVYVYGHDANDRTTCFRNAAEQYCCCARITHECVNCEISPTKYRTEVG